MLLQLRHVLARPKSGRRSIIHPRNHWLEIRELRYPSRVYTKSPMKKIESLTEPDDPPVFRTPLRWRYSIPKIKLASGAVKSSNINVESQNSDHPLLNPTKWLSCKKLQPDDSNANKNSNARRIWPKMLPPCFERPKSNIRLINSRSPRSILRSRQLNRSTKPNGFDKGCTACTCNQSVVSLERKNKPTQLRKLNDKSLRNRHVKSPYLVNPCVPPPKLLPSKPKVRSLMRMEQTPAFQYPPKIHLKDHVQHDKCRYKSSPRSSKTKVSVSLAAKQACQRNKPLHTIKANSSGTKLVGSRICNMRRHSQISSAVLEEKSSGRPVSHAKKTIPSPRSQRGKTLRSVKSFESFGTLLHRHSFFAKGHKSSHRHKRREENAMIPKQVDMKRADDNDDGLMLVEVHTKQSNKAPDVQNVQKLCEKTSSYNKMHRLPILKCHGPGSVMAERLACDKRLLCGKIKWNRPNAVRLLNTPKTEVKIIEATGGRKSLLRDSPTLPAPPSCPEARRDEGLEQLNKIIPESGSLSAPEAVATGGPLSSLVGQTFQLKGSLVERVLSRFGNSERTGKLCELAHTLLPNVEIPSC